VGRDVLDGEEADGELADGEVADGEVADGEVADGEVPMEDAPLSGPDGPCPGGAGKNAGAMDEVPRVTAIVAAVAGPASPPTRNSASTTAVLGPAGSGSTVARSPSVPRITAWPGSLASAFIASGGYSFVIRARGGGAAGRGAGGAPHAIAHSVRASTRRFPMGRL
jgi:hypothetical protein